MTEPFNWVKAKHECSTYSVFKLLEADATEDVKQRNLLRGPEDVYGFKIQAASSEMFIVMRMQNTRSRSVKFLCEPSCIVVQNDTTELFRATTTLDKDGLCKLKVGSDECERWQVLHKALEGLFFGE